MASALETPAEPAGVVTPPLVDLPLRPGRSIVEYKRAELLDLIRDLAESGQALSDDQLIMYARTVLDCPSEENC